MFYILTKLNDAFHKLFCYIQDMEVSYQNLLNKAIKLSQEGIDWHHHYLPPECILIDVRKHVIVLEFGDQKIQSSFDTKPMKQLEQLENIFFKRTSNRN